MYGPVEYVLLALVILSTTLVIVALITVVSTLAKSVKEATMFLTPLMIVVMLVGVLGMFGDAKAEVAYYLVPLYNSVQCMIGIFSFDFQPLNVAVCVIANSRTPASACLRCSACSTASASCSRARPAPLARYRRKEGWSWKMIFKNKHGMVRSGWIIALCMAAFYALGYAFSALLIDACA